jgi:hypothetical protein
MILNRPRPLIFIRVGRTCLARNSFYKSNPMRTPWFGSDAGASIRPVRHISLTGVACRTSYRNQDRSDRPKAPVRPVRPTWSARCQIWVSTYVPCFWQRIRAKKTFLNWKTLRMMFNKTTVVHIFYSSWGWCLLRSPLLPGPCWLDRLLFNLLLYCSSLA